MTTPDATPTPPENQRYALVYGAAGWIGAQLCDLLTGRDYIVYHATARTNDVDAVRAELDSTPEGALVFNAAGRTGGPPSWTVDWLEDHREEAWRDNFEGPYVLARECARRGLHLTYLGTGCIYEYDEAHAWGGAGFTEDDEPNFAGSFYSHVKGITDQVMRAKFGATALNLRIRMPVSDDLHARSFVKIGRAHV